MNGLTLIIGNKKYSSWSFRPWIAMRHYEIPFEEIVIPLDRPDTTGNIKKYSPTGRVPALQTGGMTVWDSIAILATLAELFPDRSFYPKGSEARGLARSVSAEMHSGFAELRKFCPMNFSRAPKSRVNMPDTVKADIARIGEIWRMMLKKFGGPYLAGDAFSIADAMYAPVVNRFRAYKLSEDPALLGYMATIMALPAWKRWEKEALSEPWSNAGTDNLA